MGLSRGEYEITEFKISNGAEEFQMINFFSGMSIQESIYSRYPTATLKLLDREDFLINLNLNGGETVSIKYNIEDTLFSWVFIIRDIIIDSVNRDSKEYTLHLEVYDSEQFKQIITRVGTGTPSTILQNIPEFEIDSEETLWKRKFLFSSWTFEDVVSFIERRSVSTSNNPGFRLFKTFEGWKYKSILDEYLKDPVKQFVPIADTAGNEVDLSDKYYTNFKINEILDYSDDIDIGGHGSTLYTVDPFNKSYSKEIAENPYNSTKSNSSVRMFKYQHSNKHNDIQAKLSEFAQERIFINTAFERNSVSFELVASGDNKIGSSYNVIILSNKTDQNNIHSLSDSLSGKYLMTDCITSLNKRLDQIVTMKRINETEKYDS